ncbi:MAG: tyrosine-type recombinase/integrase [Ruminococcus sp.]|nr:tyrosine-type recombinase/integrase [Ruminococcus sp.]
MEETDRTENTKITEEMLGRFQRYLKEEEKSVPTIQKYMREARNFARFLKGGDIEKEKVIAYRILLQKKYQARTVNGKLSAVNAYLSFSGNGRCKVRFLKIQHNAFIDAERELEEQEYKRLLSTAKKQKDERLYYILLTLSGTGIRVGELKYITAEAVCAGGSEITLKGKNRKILLSGELKDKLAEYMKCRDIRTGPLFRTRNGNPMDRSNICHEMKKLCSEAGVSEGKVFPHNLRHLFARKYFEIDKNLPHLADILGHSSIETTRIYVAASAREYEKVLEQMRFIEKL